MEKVKITSSTFTFRNKVVRVIWGFFYIFMFRYTPTPFFVYRSFLLKIFGANVSLKSRVYPSAKIWLPSNLIMGIDSTLGPDSKIYNQGVVTISDSVIVSQGAYLCASTHDYNDPVHPLILSPITIEDNVWICAEAFVGPGVTVNEGAVIGARAVLMSDAESWSVYAGNPAVKIKARECFNEP